MGAVRTGEVCPTRGSLEEPTQPTQGARTSHTPMASHPSYLGSYGGGLVDYLGADRIVTPPTARHGRAQSERLSISPHTYQVVETASGSALAPPAPAALSVASSAPLLGSFTRAVRWHPSSFALWAGVRITASRTCNVHAARVTVGHEVSLKARGLLSRTV